MRKLILCLVLSACSRTPTATTTARSSAIEVPLVQAQTVTTFTNVYPYTDAHGGHPRSGLTLAPDGRLYGVNWQNGPNSGGDASHSCSSNYYWGITGGDPNVQKNECPGTLYSIKVDGTDLKIEHAFTKIDPTLGRNVDGYQPIAALTVGIDGWLYGTTSQGGSPASPTIRGCGTAFKMKPGAPETFATVYNFCSQARFQDGANPLGSLVHDGLGNAYVAANGAGPCTPTCPGGAGVIAKINLTTGVATHVFAFKPAQAGTSPQKNADGIRPYATPTIGPDGRLWGWTVFGGENGFGTVFAIDLFTKSAQVFHHFPAHEWKINNDNGPVHSLTLSTAGEWWGANPFDNGYGTIFKIDRKGIYHQVYAFSMVTSATPPLPRFSNADGAQPMGGLYEDLDHRMWGTSFYGGANGYGAIYWIGCDGSFHVGGSFGPPTGPGPSRVYSTLIRVGEKLYGATYAGGTGFGTVFTIDLN